MTDSVRSDMEPGRDRPETLRVFAARDVVWGCAFGAALLALTGGVTAWVGLAGDGAAGMERVRFVLAGAVVCALIAGAVLLANRYGLLVTGQASRTPMALGLLAVLGALLLLAWEYPDREVAQRGGVQWAVLVGLLAAVCGIVALGCTAWVTVISARGYRRRRIVSATVATLAVGAVAAGLLAGLTAKPLWTTTTAAPVTVTEPIGFGEVAYRLRDVPEDIAPIAGGFVGKTKDGVTAYNGADGTQRWRFAFEVPGVTDFAVRAGGTEVVATIGTEDAPTRSVGLDAMTGEIRWESFDPAVSARREDIGVRFISRPGSAECAEISLDLAATTVTCVEPDTLRVVGDAGPAVITVDAPAGGAIDELIDLGDSLVAVRIAGAGTGELEVVVVDTTSGVEVDRFAVPRHFSVAGLSRVDDGVVAYLMPRGDDSGAPRTVALRHLGEHRTVAVEIPDSRNFEGHGLVWVDGRLLVGGPNALHEIDPVRAVYVGAHSPQCAHAKISWIQRVSGALLVHCRSDYLSFEDEVVALR